METAEDVHVAARRPGALDVAAGLGLAATVVLHVVAMVPNYFSVNGSLMSQTDQATLYAIVAAAWALALAVGLTGPHRTPVAAGLAVGVAVTELGFRVVDIGLAASSNEFAAGVWLMSLAWLVGAVSAGLAVMAARTRHRRPPEPIAGVGPEAEMDVDWAAPGGAVAGPDGSPTNSTNTTALPAAGGAEVDDDHERSAWTLLVVILAAVTAGAFLPAWDRIVVTSSVTGQSVSVGQANAFKGPWQEVIGNVLAAIALLAVPAVAVRLRSKAAGAAAACGALLMLASQLASAVVQVDQPLTAERLGYSSSQVQQLGIVASLKLTGWFTVDTLAAYALFAAIMIWATLRTPQDSSAGAPPSTPDVRSEAMRSAS